MKARKENGQIKVYGQVPQDFENILNFGMAGDEIHRQKGFYDVVAPEFDPDYWRQGELYFDQEMEVFTYELVLIPVAEVKERLEADFELAKDRTRKELLDALVDKMIELHRSQLPEGLVQLWDILKAENQRVSSDIEALAVNDPDQLRRYRIRQEDIESFVANIQKHKL